MRARKKLQSRIEEFKKQYSQSMDAFKDAVKEQVDSLESKRDSIKERLIKAQEITQQQLELRAQTDMPSKNAMHSRYKNGLIGEIKKLEEDKRTVLESILKDGYDPIITVVDESGGQKNISLSEFLGVSAAANTPEVPAETQPQVRQAGKFTVIKGGIS